MVPAIRTAEERSAPAARLRNRAGAAVPPFAVAVLEALRFEGRSTAALARLDEKQWRQLLGFCDREQLTLLLEWRAGEALPPSVRDRIRRNAREYAPRFDRLKRSLADVAGALEERGIPFAVLKGLAHAPDFTPDPFLRQQGDIDLWCPGGVLEARAAAAAIGFRVMGDSPGRHLPPMVRERNWNWTANYFAADLPIALELHYELWDDAAEGITAPGQDEFWDRRVPADFDGRTMAVLAAPDALGFACLHLLMHILHGDLRLQRAWEIANFLHTRSGDDAFWSRWGSLHSPRLRLLEAVIFDLVAGWFGAALSPAAESEIKRLPDDVRLWLDRYGQAPIEALFRPRKDEIWLHLALLDSPRRKYAVFLRRVFPAAAGMGAARGAARSAFLAPRLAHHLRALPPTLAGTVRWGWRRTGLGRPFLQFQLAASLYGFGVVAFVVLYNLFLLSLGFREAFMGKVAGVMMLGTLAGSLPAAALTRRIGLRRALLVATLGVAAASLARVSNESAAWQIGASFVSGIFFSLWAVVYSPAIAALSEEKNRPLAFSISCAVGMTVCGVGGLAAGQLPGFLARHFHWAAGHASEKGVLLLASGLIGLAAVGAWRLRFPPLPPAQTRVYPRSGSLLRLLGIVSLWAAATGAFNPFFNSFFALRQHMGAARIGNIYFASQTVQAAALLSAPALLRRFGNARTIACLQLLAGLALAGLALPGGAALAVAAYIGYCSFQFMAEPGIFTMLMDGVAEGERSGASALYFMATSIAGALAASGGGAAIAHFGYPAVLMVSAAVASICAGLSWRYLR